MGKYKHGDCQTSEYNTWQCMKARCLNQNNPRFEDYGARGIYVCERWKKYENFIADMGKKPSPELTLERRDNDGNYEPSNCYWGTDDEQRNNKRTNVFIEYNNVSHTIRQWSKIFNINYHQFWSSISIRKLSIEEIIANPYPREQAITYNGETLNSCEWAKRLGMSRKNFYRGKYRNMSKEKVIEIFYNKKLLQTG